MSYLLSKKHNVLLIDSDPQCNCASKYGISTSEGTGKLGELLNDRMQDAVKHAPIENYVVNNPAIPRVDILAGGKSLNTMVYDVVFQSNAIKALMLFKKIVQEVTDMDKYDFIMIDTSPTFGNEINSLLLATDWIITPVLADTDAIDGANTTLKFLGPVREMNPDLKVAGIFFNQVVDRSKAIHELEPAIREAWGNDVFKTRVPYNPAAVSASINEGEPVTKRYANSKASSAFESLLKEVLVRVNEA